MSAQVGQFRARRGLRRVQDCKPRPMTRHIKDLSVCLIGWRGSFAALGLLPSCPATRLIHRTAVYGPVRTVVWEGWRRETPPIPILISAISGRRRRRRCPRRDGGWVTLVNRLKAVPPHFVPHVRAPAPNIIMRRTATSERTLTTAHKIERSPMEVPLSPHDRRATQPRQLSSAIASACAPLYPTGAQKRA